MKIFNKKLFLFSTFFVFAIVASVFLPNYLSANHGYNVVGIVHQPRSNTNYYGSSVPFDIELFPSSSPCNAFWTAYPIYQLDHTWGQDGEATLALNIQPGQRVTGTIPYRDQDGGHITYDFTGQTVSLVFLCHPNASYVVGAGSFYPPGYPSQPYGHYILSPTSSGASAVSNITFGPPDPSVVSFTVDGGSSTFLTSPTDTFNVRYSGTKNPISCYMRHADTFSQSPPSHGSSQWSNYVQLASCNVNASNLTFLNHAPAIPIVLTNEQYNHLEIVMDNGKGMSSPVVVTIRPTFYYFDLTVVENMPLPKNSSATLVWDAGFSASCVGSLGTGSWAGSKLSRSTSYGPIGYDTGQLSTDTTFSLTCTSSGRTHTASVTVQIDESATLPICGNFILDNNEECDQGPSGGSTCSSSCLLTVPPIITSFVANPSPVGAGNSVNLSYTVVGAQNCERRSSPIDTVWSGNDFGFPTPSPEITINGASQQLFATKAFRVRCNNSFGWSNYSNLSVSVVAVNGDGIIDPPEECDDGNTTDNDGCTDGNIDPGWSCVGEPSVCRKNPTISSFTTTDSQIDLGEAVNINYTILDNIGGYCLRNSLPVVGPRWDEDRFNVHSSPRSGGVGNIKPNVTTDFFLQCINEIGVSTATSSLRVSVNSPGCGDGSITGSEECDDGDVDNGDGCSSACAVENNWSCTGEPSVCTQTQCSDGLDNDGDSLIDDGNDPSCSNPNDNDESSACNDTLDNDADGDIDMADSGCADQNDNNEAGGGNFIMRLSARPQVFSRDGSNVLISWEIGPSGNNCRLSNNGGLAELDNVENSDPASARFFVNARTTFTLTCANRTERRSVVVTPLIEQIEI